MKARSSTSGPALGSLLLASFGTLGSALDGAAKPPDVKVVKLGDSFTLKVSESALIEGEAFKVGFVEVAGDSRCPKNERCVWEGDATVRIWVQKADAPKQRLELHSSSREKDTASDSGYEARLLRLDPPPFSGRTTAPADYLATLRVNRGSSAGTAER